MKADNQCFDDDRFNIKFVSHFVDIPDNQEADESNSKDKQKAGKTKSGPNHSQKSKNDKDSRKSRVSLAKTSSRPGGSRSPSVSQQSASSSQKSSNTNKSASSSKKSSNKNKSSRPDRNRSTSASEHSELETSQDDVDDIRGMSYSNNRKRRYSSSEEDFDDEDSSQSTQPMSSSNDDEEVQEDLDSEVSSESDDQEILILYGQIRQIIRGPATSDPANVLPLPTAEVTNAEEDKETLSPLTVVTNSPAIIDPDDSTKDQTDTGNEQRDSAIDCLYGDVEKEDDVDWSLTSSVRSEAARKASTAACARAARSRLYKTQSHYRERGRLSPTNDVIATPWSISTSLMPRPRESLDDVTESSSMEDVPLVAARRTTPQYGRGASPWLTDQSSTDDRSNGRTASSAAAAEISEPTRLSLSLHPLQPHHPQHQQQQQQNKQQHHVPVKRCRTDSMTAVPRRPPPAMARLRNELEYLMAPAGVIADLPLEAATDQTERKIVVANVTAHSSPLLPQLFHQKDPPAAAPMVPCLKYHSTADSSSSPSSQVSNSQRRRRIRFAPEVKQQTLV